MRRSALRLVGGFGVGGGSRRLKVPYDKIAKHLQSSGIPLCSKQPIYQDFRGFCTNPPSDENAQLPSQPSVIVDRLEGMPIVTIGINRPEKRNSVDTETSEALKLAFQVFEGHVFQ